LKETSTLKLSWKQRQRRHINMERAWAEVSWFCGKLGAVVPDPASPEHAGAQRIDRWIKKLPAFHRGAFALRYTPRSWPEALAEAFGEETSLVVRIDCASHPAVGKSTVELEAASVERLLVLVAESERDSERRKHLGDLGPSGPNERRVLALCRRAHSHVASAVKAMRKVRGNAPCMVPSWVDPEEASDECDA
jgi:hypothetical protein